MRRCLLRPTLIAASFVLAACGSRAKDAPSADPNAIVVNAAGLWIGSERIGDAPADEPWKMGPFGGPVPPVPLAGFRARLDQRRSDWLEAHLGKDFPGFTIEVGPGVPCQTALGVYFATLMGGSPPSLPLKQGATTVELPSSYGSPRTFHNPPEIGWEAEATRRREQEDLRSACVTFQANEGVELKPFHARGAYDVVPPASLAATVEEWCGKNVDCPLVLTLRCDAGVPFSTVLAPLAVLRRGAARLRLEPWNPTHCEAEAGPRSPPTSHPSPAAQLPPRWDVVDSTFVRSGAWTSVEVHAALEPKLADLRACYAEGLARSPGLLGKVTATLDVGKKGAVMRARDAGSSLSDASTLDCVMGVLSTVAFPAKGAIGSVTTDLLFGKR